MFTQENEFYKSVCTHFVQVLRVYRNNNSKETKVFEFFLVKCPYVRYRGKNYSVDKWPVWLTFKGP